MATIAQTLELTQEQHEERTFQRWFKWCEFNAQHFTHVLDGEQKHRDFQRLLANAGLNRWWHRQLAKLEIDFKEEARHYQGNLDVSVLQDLYYHHVSTLFNIYPKALIKYARTNNHTSKKQ